MATDKSMAIIATQGTLDWAYPPLILATTAAAMDYRVSIFYTFYGLQVLRKKLDLRISPLGKPRSVYDPFCPATAAVFAAEPAAGFDRVQQRAYLPCHTSGHSPDGW